MSLQGNSTYSFKDLTGVLVSPLAGQIIIAGGNIGLGQITIDMTATRSEIDAAADGAIMTSAIAGGDHATVTLEMQQTSPLHKFLLQMNNLHQTALNSGDVTFWAASALDLTAIFSGAQHIGTGVSIMKTPPKVYAARGAMLSWTLLAANMVNL